LSTKQEQRSTGVASHSLFSGSLIQALPRKRCTIVPAPLECLQAASSPHAYLLVVFHHLSFGQAAARQLIPSPLHCTVQELFNLPLREYVWVPKQLIFILIG